LGQLVLVDGPPGAGKSAVARIVATAAPRPTVHLHTDSFYAWIRSGFVPPYLPQARAQNEVVTTVMTGAACAYAQGGYDVIVDGIIGPWLLPVFIAAGQRARLGLRLSSCGPAWRSRWLALLAGRVVSSLIRDLLLVCTGRLVILASWNVTWSTPAGRRLSRPRPSSSPGSLAGSSPASRLGDSRRGEQVVGVSGPSRPGQPH
jgi:hypothetical protein